LIDGAGAKNRNRCRRRISWIGRDLLPLQECSTLTGKPPFGRKWKDSSMPLPER
jgi:hypothetical protein